MKAFAAAAGLNMLVAMPVSDAFAVDVVNEDKNPYQLVIMDDYGQRSVEIQAGQSLRNLCSACAVTIETDDPLEAHGTETVLIKDGKLWIQDWSKATMR